MSKKILKSEEIGNLYFGQLHYLHQEFFDKIAHQHTRIKLRDLPHYTVLRDGKLGDSNNIYYKYLKNSWDYYFPSNNTDKRRNKKILDFQQLFQDIEKNGVKNPILITETCNGGYVIVDGNHRASVAYHLSQNIPYKIINQNDFLKGVVKNSMDRYGTNDQDIPYQSIHYGEKVLLSGRRVDIYERFMKIAPSDIRGKSVLDMGSNIASSGSLAWYYGAKEVVAMEFSPRIASAALRISTILGSNISVKVQDLGRPIKKGKKYDTVFCFSLDAHVKDKRILRDNILKSVGGTLYLEGHEHRGAEDYEYILKNFRKVEMIGYNKDGIHSKKATRPFFRCIK